MVKRPKLTVITINYNNADGLKKTLLSVRQQTNKNFQYLVIDGGSTDASIDLINQNLDIIDLWVSEQDMGEYDGMNKGIRMASGQYAMFLNSGDVFYSADSVSNLLTAEFTEDFVYADVCIDYGHISTLRRYPDKLGAWFLYSEMICHQVQIIKLSLLKKLGGYDTMIKIVADYDLMIHALVGKKVSYKHVPCFLATYAWGGKSTQPAAAETIRKGKEAIQNKYFDPKMLQILQEFDQTTNSRYQAILQSRAYQILRALEKIPWLLSALSGFANGLLRIRNLAYRLRGRKLT